MLVQKASDLSPQSRSVQQVAHGAGIVEEFPLQLCWQGIPQHDQRGPEASKDMLLLFSKSGAIWILLRSVKGVLVIIRQPLLVIRERGETLSIS
jgi:hypothetical protein